MKVFDEEIGLKSLTEVTDVTDLGEVEDLINNEEVKKPFRILSLNGGGARALFQAHYLNQMSKKTSTNFWEEFDLIIGTSAGAIIAAALCCGIHPKEIIELLTAKENNPFPNPVWVGIKTKILKVTRGAGFDNAGLKIFLDKIFGKDTLFSDCQSSQLAVTATHLSDSSVRVFSPISKQSDSDLRIVDALMASTALPGAFKPYSINETQETGEVKGEEYIDGCMWANAPLLAAVSLAVNNGKCSLSDIRIVSIGTTGKNYGSSLDKHMDLRVDSKAFYEHLLNISLSSAEETAQEAVVRLVGKENMLHVDECLETEIRAWEWAKAIGRLPQVAADIVNREGMSDKLDNLLFN